MDTRQEKLDILSQMIAFARVDQSLKNSEYQFLVGVAANLGINKDSFDALLKQKVAKPVFKSQAERIVQFHRLVLLMNIDEEQHEKEIHTLHNIGLKMGLPPSAVTQVLQIMHKYPNKLVPPEVLIEIFKAHYN
ncbi:TerB family tellurite resistance protein [Flagellimonas allohymeniacidonis]|uniref:TerB family tellurite resistance protein n=1 Tax=Flagellimonas allohymeniacidonis TaxID=2517819 RepID=A0A4Q8QG12_9FLAO|nr:TerB family tellurite resistance protein [Allomuricauda hymeniacidonis]TAI49401.1 TerB family tellurite resistance protein [Allomuricauda hymeniacidonis]